MCNCDMKPKLSTMVYPQHLPRYIDRVLTKGRPGRAGGVQGRWISLDGMFLLRDM